MGERELVHNFGRAFARLWAEFDAVVTDLHWADPEAQARAKLQGVDSVTHQIRLGQSQARSALTQCPGITAEEFHVSVDRAFRQPAAPLYPDPPSPLAPIPINVSRPPPYTKPFPERPVAPASAPTTTGARTHVFPQGASYNKLGLFL
ncbi:hypothetical protein DIPPA_19158 [Diplonema papillatum]|nr:hypothetical protein DIPPA_19158 [Diplonema papillatum]